MTNFIRITLKTVYEPSLNTTTIKIKDVLDKFYGVDINEDNIYRNCSFGEDGLVFDLTIGYRFSVFNHKNENGESQQYKLPVLLDNYLNEFKPLIYKAESVKSFLSANDDIEYVMENGKLSTGKITATSDNWLAVANSKVETISYCQVVRKVR